MRQRGLSLIELMIALTLGLVLLIGIGSLFVYSSRSNKENDAIAGMQDQGRFALATLARDLSLAGYWGGLYGTANLSPRADEATSATNALPASAGCGPDASSSWVFNFSRLEFRNHNSGNATSALWRCIGHQQADTDVVALHRVAGRETASMTSADSTVTLRPHHYYLKTNGVAGTLIRWGASATASPTDNASVPEAPFSPPMSFFRFEPRIYFVRDYSRSVGDGIPALCRKTLCPSGYTAGDGIETATCGADGASAGSSGLYSECIAEGVEDMQIVWGIDTNNDGTVERYTSTPSTAQIEQARTAQVSLLVRSTEGRRSSTDSKTYQLGDRSVTPSGDSARYFRRVYSTTVLLHNRVN